MLTRRPNLLTKLCYQSRLFTSKVTRTQLENGQNTSIHIQSPSSKTDISFSTDWIDHTVYTYPEGSGVEITTEKTEDSYPEERIVATSDTTLEAQIPQDTSRFTIKTLGNLKGTCGMDKKFIVHKKIDIEAVNVHLSKARTNQFHCTSDSLTVNSSLEANNLYITNKKNLKIDKKLGVPTYGEIQSKGDITIEAIYGPTHYIGDVDEQIQESTSNKSKTAEEIKDKSLNIKNEGVNKIYIGNSHGNLHISCPSSTLELNEVSNIGLYVDSKSISGIFKKVGNFAYLKASDKIELTLDSNLLGSDIILVNQSTNLKKKGRSLQGSIFIDIQEESQLSIEYLSSFEILKKKIESNIARRNAE
ncbi:unnamed protein product [Moneuplotes crassus]|uniref:Adhesin domain-containing protein n=1 Tax=Euplotes crassus TaxID=5936 RepID=A0AAD1XHM0_EUPCR|nr:unnamed protein product [Moneuplotes crassus]